MSYEQQAEDYHINKVCDIEEPEDLIIELGCLGNNEYKITLEQRLDGTIYVMYLNDAEFDEREILEDLQEIVKQLKYYEVFTKWLEKRSG